MAESWSRVECEAIVSDHMEMLTLECRGERYSKAAHRRALQQRLESRSAGSIEYKHQNISAVLLRHGHTYIDGYKPAWNYQALLEEVVLARIDKDAALIIAAEQDLIGRPSTHPKVDSWSSVFVALPERSVETAVREPPGGSARKVNYAEREAKNRKLGEMGEAFVLDIECARLGAMGRNDLVGEIEWTSKDKGDGAGYDIRSFNGKTDDELFIEVKTTNSGMYQPFLISRNELAFSEANARRYSLYRVFGYNKSPGIYELQGSVKDYVTLAPTLFRATF